jgi:predicted ArsR family transcriptional regulator
MRRPVWNIDELILEAIDAGETSASGIAFDAGISDTTVRRHLDALAEDGVIERTDTDPARWARVDRNDYAFQEEL